MVNFCSVISVHWIQDARLKTQDARHNWSVATPSDIPPEAGILVTRHASRVTGIMISEICAPTGDVMLISYQLQKQRGRTNDKTDVQVDR